MKDIITKILAEANVYGGDYIAQEIVDAIDETQIAKGLIDDFKFDIDPHDKGDEDWLYIPQFFDWLDGRDK